MNRGNTLAAVMEESGELLNSTNSSGNLLDKENEYPDTRSTKRYRVFCELVETEQNYVNVLETVIDNFKTPLEKYEEEEGKELVSKHNQHVLFSKAEILLHMHRSILSSLQAYEKNWNEKCLIGQTYATVKPDLLKYYVPYINSYDEILEILEQIRSNPRVNEFIKQCEAHSSKRFSFKDLLIRPVQRLPSVSLLLKELQKATNKHNPDFSWLKQALDTIDEVLKRSNDSREMTDNHSNTLEVANRIDSFPADLISASRSFYCQADLQVINAAGMFEKYSQMHLTFFLFNDVVIVAKRRGRIQSFYHPNRTRFGSNTTLNSTLSEGSANLNGSKSGVTLQRNLSFMSMSKRERKPFKFLEALRFPSFRMFFYTYGDGMFYLKMRDEMYEEMCSFRITGETSMPIAKDFFENMCTLINVSSKRELNLTEISDELDKDASESYIHEDDRKFILKSRRNALFRKNSGRGGVSSQGSLRRSLSTMTVGMVRLISKSNIKNISSTHLSVQNN